MPRPSLLTEAARYFLVTVFGLGIDLAMAIMFVTAFGWNDYGAVTLSVAVAAVANYFGHEFWTFQRAGSRLSWHRLGAYLASVCITLIVRYVVLAIAVIFLPGETSEAIVRLVLAAGFSFAVGFLIARAVIFKQFTVWAK